MGLLDRIQIRDGSIEPPESVNVTEKQEIRFVWPGGREAVVTSMLLRESCPCSGCIEEGTGRKILDPATLDPNVHPLSIEPIGFYALKFVWSDGHDAGLYSWAFLRNLTLPQK